MEKYDYQESVCNGICLMVTKIDKVSAYFQ
jgi:hypothetical protein